MLCKQSPESLSGPGYAPGIKERTQDRPCPYYLTLFCGLHVMVAVSLASRYYLKLSSSPLFLFTISTWRRRDFSYSGHVATCRFFSSLSVSGSLVELAVKLVPAEHKKKKKSQPAEIKQTNRSGCQSALPLRGIRDFKPARLVATRKKKKRFEQLVPLSRAMKPKEKKKKKKKVPPFQSQ